MSSGNNRMNYIRFDVGHQLFVCHKDTLEKYPSSTFSKFIAPEFDRRTSELDYIVIDRDGKHFESILNYMRDPSSLDLDKWSDDNIKDLMREADYYCLSELAEICDQQLVDRETKHRLWRERLHRAATYEIQPNCKLQMIFGCEVMRDFLASRCKPTIVVSYKIMRDYRIEHWILELLRITDFDRFEVYCFFPNSPDLPESTVQPETPRSDRFFTTNIYNSCIGKRGERLNTGKEEFFCYVFDHRCQAVSQYVRAPPKETFKERRDRYKCRIFRFWFNIHSIGV